MSHVADTYRCKRCGTPKPIERIVLDEKCDCGSNEFLHFRPADEDARCDFCSSHAVKYAYPCRDFRQEIIPGAVNVPEWGSDGWWAACEPCFKFIQRSDRTGLAMRSAKLYVEAHPQSRSVGLVTVAKRIRQLHDAFWANREGPPLEHLEVSQ